MKKSAGLLFVLILLKLTAQAQLAFDTLSSVDAMVRSAFLSDGIEISNIRYTGSVKAIQVFTNQNNLMPVKAGLYLGTGSYRNAKGPNYDNGMSFMLNTRGDAQLTQLAGQSTLDAAILEFDFVPSSDSISFRYVFASEEYPEYVGSKFNDVFAFYISGAGIKGIKNLAVLPKSKTAITVNNVNDKKNRYYYLDNAYRVYDPFSRLVDTLDIQFDGFTRLLEARCAVIPWQTYHLKICIADVKDAIYDSGVFLESGSFKSSGNTPPVSRNKEKKKVKSQVQLLSPRYLGSTPEQFAARIYFDSNVVNTFTQGGLTEERFQKILTIIRNYPRGEYVIDLGVSDKQKNAFADYLQQKLLQHDIALNQLSIQSTTPVKNKKSRQLMNEPATTYVVLLIKQKSRPSEE
ncbi:MAG TPA: choice-of-anchor L domain-containing protein [Bacteroidia bacterium]|nr:choice-of-anchor L domain-containing protein [Bacteroidia bacterium]